MNVRELKQALDVAAVLSEGGVVRAADLPESVTTGPVAAPLDGEDVALRDELAQRLAATDRSVSQVARDMGQARQQVQRWMKRLGLSRARSAIRPASAEVTSSRPPRRS